MSFPTLLILLKNFALIFIVDVFFKIYLPSGGFGSKDLEKDLKGETSGDLKRLLVGLSVVNNLFVYLNPIATSALTLFDNKGRKCRIRV